MTAVHGQQVAADGLHGVVSLSYADSTARLAATGFLSTDLHKLAIQLSDSTLWVLTDTAAPTWTQVSTGAHTGGGGGGSFVPADPAVYAEVFDHFTGYFVTTTRLINMGFLSQYNSGGAVTRANGIQGHPGLMRLKGLAASATGRASFYMGGASSILFGGGTIKHVIETLCYINAVPNATDDYRFTFGFGTDVGSGSTNLHGASFLIERAINATNYVCQTADNFTITNADSGVAPVVGWVKLRIEVNKAGTSAEFFIDDVSVSVVGTNVPTATGREVTGFAKIKKLAGATDQYVDLDWWHYVADAR